MLDDPHQAAAGADQPLEHRLGPAEGGRRSLGRRPLPAALAEADRAVGPQGPLGAVVGGAGGVAQALQGVHKEVLHRVVAVVDKDPPGLGVKGADPLQQALAVGVARHAAHLGDLGLHLDLLAEQLDPVDPLHQGAAQGAHRLVAHKEDGAFLPPEVVLQVVADAAGVAHPAGRKDDLGGRVRVDRPGLVAGDADPQPRERDGVGAGVQQGLGLGVKAGLVGVPENAGGLDGQGAVDVHREIAVAGHQVFLLDLADEIEQLLGAAHRKAGDDHVAAPVKGALQDLHQLPDVIGAGRVAAVAVGGLHDDVVRLGQVGGVFQDGLVQVADVPRKDQLGGLVPFGDPELDAGRAQQVAHVGKAGLHPGGKLHFPAIIHPDEQADGGLGVLDGVIRLHRGQAGAGVLAVFPLRLRLLDVGGVPQHDVAQAAGGPGGVDPAPVALFGQQGQMAAVVDVGVGQQDPVDLPGGDGQGLVLVDILALLHAAVDQEMQPARLQQGTAARNFMVRA